MKGMDWYSKGEAMICKGIAQPRKGLAKYCVAKARHAQHRLDKQRRSMAKLSSDKQRRGEVLTRNEKLGHRRAQIGDITQSNGIASH